MAKWLIPEAGAQSSEIDRLIPESGSSSQGITPPLIPNDVTISLTCDQPALSEILSPNDCLISLTCDQPTLTNILIPDEIILTLSCDQPALGAILSPNDCLISLTCDQPQLIAILNPNDCLISLTCDQPLLLELTLYPNDCLISLTCDPASNYTLLSPDDTYISLIVDQAQIMPTPDDCLISLTCDPVAMGHIVIDWSIASTAELLLEENYTFIVAFNGARNGQVCELALKQDATGGRQIGFPSNVRDGTDITLPLSLSAANLTDYVYFRYRESLDIYDLIFFRKGF